VLIDTIWEPGPNRWSDRVLDWEVERALIVVAHPDDVDFWAGGTVACWTSAGIAVAYCVLTDGTPEGSIRVFLVQPSPTSAEMSRRQPL
jgi:hypothetical protein